LGRSLGFDYLTLQQKAQLREMVGVSAYVPVTNPLAQPAPRPETAIYGDDQTYLNYFKDQNPTAFFGFSSLQKFTEYVAALKIPPQDGAYNRNSAWCDDGDNEWRGTDNMAQCLEIARNGWSDGLSMFEKFKIEHATAKRRQHNMAGGIVNVGRLLAGNPKHMMHRKKRPAQKSITLFVETFLQSKFEPIVPIMRALLIAGIIDVLEREEYSVEIIAIDINRDKNMKPGQQSVIKLKSAGERLNLLDITFALGHPSFVRRMLFACNSSAPECSSTWLQQGFLSIAFDASHPTRKNEYYIGPLIDGDWSVADPMSMLPYIEPENLPVKIRNER
jgi:hypothetical protein